MFWDEVYYLKKKKTFLFGAEEILIENEQADSNTKNKFRNGEEFRKKIFHHSQS